jgi:hypothetical protein
MVWRQGNTGNLAAWSKPTERGFRRQMVLPPLYDNHLEFCRRCDRSPIMKKPNRRRRIRANGRRETAYEE